MKPNFSKKTIETLAKRAAYICSNPDCRANTIGPNTKEDHYTKIGEAAHIYGARAGAKRFNVKMTDISRSEITNGIWLCRNCHKTIDTDELKYTHTLLFKWREIHETYIATNLGNTTDKIVHEEQQFKLRDFDKYNPMTKRIIIDKPIAWEFKLTSELMNVLNKPLFRKLDDLKNGLYIGEIRYIQEDMALDWVINRLNEMQRITLILNGLLPALNKSWGELGEEGNEHEILHVCTLYENYINKVIEFEEKIKFEILPEDFRNFSTLLMNVIGSQIQKLKEIPVYLEEAIEMSHKMHENTIEEDIVIKKMIKFELPQNWDEQFNAEMEKLRIRRLG